MPTFEHTIDVAAPADRVFAFVTDPANWLRTHGSLRDLEIVEESDDEVRMDATYRMLGIANHLEMTQRVVEPGARSVVSFDSPGLSGEIEYRFTESNGITTVRESADYEFGDSVPDRVVEPVGKRYNERQFRHALEKMRALMDVELKVVEPMAAA